MFGGKTEKQGNAASNSQPTNVSNSIVEGTEIRGDIKATNDIRIDGVLVGKLECNGRVIIGAQGKIEGEIQCANAIIEGSFKGNITVKELLAIKETGSVIGDISTEKILIQTGATFNGKCTMGGLKVSSLVQEPS